MCGLIGNYEAMSTKRVNKAEEWVGKVMWMSRVNGQVGVDRGQMAWELMGRLSVEHAAEVWWSGGRGVCRKMESAQMRVGRRLLRASNIVAGVAVQGDVGWRKLEERREEMKVLFGKRLEGMEESRLVKMVVEKLREYGGIGWRKDYEVLRRKFELGNEVGLVGMKNKIKARNEKDCEEEVYTKCTLKWYRLAKDDTGVERYVRSAQGQESVRLLFRLRTGSAGLLEDKKRCRMVSGKSV